MLQSNGQKQVDSLGEVYSEEQVRRCLEFCGIDIVDEHDDWIDIFCPYHNNTRTRSAGVNKETGIFHCFSCSTKASLTELIMHITGRTFFEAERLIGSKLPFLDILDFVNKTIDKQEFVEYDLDLIERLHNNLLESTEAKNYLYSRGINDESILKYNLGFSIQKEMVIIPIHCPKGVCIGFVARTIGKEKEYKNSPGLKRSKTLFNIHRIKKYNEVYIAESSFDPIILEQAGFYAAATMGASVSRDQIDLLKRYFNNINLIPDTDSAGTEMINKILERIPYCNIVRLPENYKDVSEMGQNGIKKYLSNKDLLSI